MSFASVSDQPTLIIHDASRSMAADEINTADKGEHSDTPIRGAGRPPKFSSPDHLESLFISWKATFKDKLGGEDEIPDVEGFCDYVDAYRDLLCEYEKKEGYSDAIKRIRNWIYYKKKQLAMQNKMNATIFIFDAKNNAGYVDRTEQDLTTKGETISNPSPLLAAEFAAYLKNKK